MYEVLYGEALQIQSITTLPDHHRNRPERAASGFVFDKTKSFIETNQPLAGCRRGIIAFGRRGEPDLDRVAVREFTKFPDDGGAGALLPIRDNNSGQFDHIVHEKSARDGQFENDALVCLFDPGF